MEFFIFNKKNYRNIQLTNRDFLFQLTNRLSSLESTDEKVFHHEAGQKWRVILRALFNLG